MDPQTRTRIASALSNDQRRASTCQQHLQKLLLSERIDIDGGEDDLIHRKLCCRAFAMVWYWKSVGKKSSQECILKGLAASMCSSLPSTLGTVSTLENYYIPRVDDAIKSPMQLSQKLGDKHSRPSPGFGKYPFWYKHLVLSSAYLGSGVLCASMSCSGGCEMNV